jgi:hypothetical protein
MMAVAGYAIVYSSNRMDCRVGEAATNKGDYTHTASFGILFAVPLLWDLSIVRRHRRFDLIRGLTFARCELAVRLIARLFTQIQHQLHARLVRGADVRAARFLGSARIVALDRTDHRVVFFIGGQ